MILHVTAVGWIGTLGALAALLGFDLVRVGRRPHAVGFREALRWSVFYISVALLYGVGFGLLAGWGFAAQYYAGYIVEKSLSVDNLFVFLIIMSTFAVPAEQQARALTVGIVAALVLRAIFIAAGAALLDAFSVMFLLFGLALIVTAVQLFRHRNEDPSIDDNALVAAARRLLPLTNRYDGPRLVTRVGGRRMLTPLFLVLLAIGSTDVLFALDSIPAVFGVTQHAYIVFVANAFALLGLRALFFLVAGLLDRLVYLSTGLALILAFIGVKLVLHFFHLREPSVPEISTGLSLVAIVILLGCATVASLIKARRDPTLRAHPGALREAKTEALSARGSPPGGSPAMRVGRLRVGARAGRRSAAGMDSDACGAPECVTTQLSGRRLTRARRGPPSAWLSGSRPPRPRDEIAARTHARTADGPAPTPCPALTRSVRITTREQTALTTTVANAMARAAPNAPPGSGSWKIVAPAVIGIALVSNVASRR